MQGQTDKYYEEKDRENTLKMRAVLDTLPRFCRQFSVESGRTLFHAPDLLTPMISVFSLSSFITLIQHAKSRKLLITPLIFSNIFRRKI